METEHATQLFESLSSPLRLQAYRLLVREGPAGLFAGDISSALGIAPSNLSFHLKAMTHAGLVSVQQEGRYQRYRANMPLMLDLITYLTEECCAGNPEQCIELTECTDSPDKTLPALLRNRSRT